MPSAVRPYERLLGRAKPVQAESRREGQRRRREGLPSYSEDPPPVEYPEPTDPVFPGNHVRLFNGVLARAKLKRDRDEKSRTAYSLRHTYICMRLMEGADIYQIAKNCRTSVEMIEKFYAAHIKSTLDAASINVRRAKPVATRKAALDVAQLLQFPPHRGLIKRDRKLLMEPLDQVDQPPTHNTVDCRDWAALDNLHKLTALRVIEQRTLFGCLPAAPRESARL